MKSAYPRRRPALVKPLAAGLLCLLAFGSGHAADEKNRFGVKGAGAARCSAFVKAYEEKSPTLPVYGGWIDGFLTAANAKTDDVFDISPWQSTEVLAYALASYCRKYPELSFFRAVQAMEKLLIRDAMQDYSPVVVARHGKKVVAVYVDVLQQVRERLFELGFLASQPKADQFDKATVEGLLAYQQSQNITQTGLPDQITLTRLLKRPGTSGNKSGR